MGRWGGMVKKEIASSPLAEVNDTTLISKERFKELLAKIDNGLRALPATAQVRRCFGVCVLRRCCLYRSDMQLCNMTYVPMRCAVFKLPRLEACSIEIRAAAAIILALSDELTFINVHRAPQVARQQGEYLAGLFASHQITGNPATTVLPADEKGFSYNHKGSLAYVGGDKAVMDIPQVNYLNMIHPVSWFIIVLYKLRWHTWAAKRPSWTSPR